MIVSLELKVVGSSALFSEQPPRAKNKILTINEIELMILIEVGANFIISINEYTKIILS